MNRSRRASVAAAVATCLVGTASAALVLGAASTHASGVFAKPGVYLFYLILIGGAFASTGLYVWWRRPENRVGPLMTAVGCAWLLRGVETSSNGVLFAIGNLAAPWAFALLTHLLLAFPSGRLTSATQRLLAAVAYVNVAVLQLVAFVFTDTRAPYAGCVGCPANPLLISSASAAVAWVLAAQSVCSLGVLAGLVVVLSRRWRAATARQRRSLSPILLTGALTLVFVASAILGASSLPWASDAFLVVALTLFACVPFAFLLGLLRSRFGEAEAMARVVSRLGDRIGRSTLRDTLAEALGDPLLDLAYWVPEISSYADSEGRRVALPDQGTDTLATFISHGGEPVAAIVHDASLGVDSNLVQTVGAAVALTLRNERLDAELKVRVAELGASRARIVRAGDEERRRIERDLHDGAQQRLLALGINLRLARDVVNARPDEAMELLDESLEELKAATAELRELARGIHPGVLTSRGLGPAIQALADRSPVPVKILDTPQGRLPSAIESAVYFAVAEALTNAARYATARQVTVSMLHRDDVVEVVVRDDGIGGADPARGSGLRGLSDRIAALNGRLHVASETGLGTTLRVRLPCG